MRQNIHEVESHRFNRFMLNEVVSLPPLIHINTTDRISVQTNV